MAVVKAFADNYDTLPAPAALYDTDGSLLCCNRAALMLANGYMNDMFRDYPDALQHILAGEIYHFELLSDDTEEPFCATGMLFGGCPMLMLSTSAGYGNVGRYVASVRERVFENWLALGRLEKAMDTDDPAAEKIIDGLRKDQYVQLRHARNIELLNSWCFGCPILHEDSVEMCSFIRAICEATSAVLTKDIPIHCSIDSDVCYALLDRDLAERAVFNLLSNSVNNTADGNEIFVSFKYRGDDLVITVSDRGQGAKPQTISELVTPFFSTEPAADSNFHPGLGLGMSVTDYFCRLHGGKLLFTGEFGSGCTAAISIPYRAGEECAKLRSSSYISDSFSNLYVEMCDSCELPH